MIFHVATVAENIHLSQSNDATFRTLVECGHRAKYASRRIEWFATGVQTFGKIPEGEHPRDSTDGDVLGANITNHWTGGYDSKATFYQSKKKGMPKRLNPSVVYRAGELDGIEFNRAQCLPATILFNLLLSDPADAVSLSLSRWVRYMSMKVRRCR